MNILRRRKQAVAVHLCKVLLAVNHMLACREDVARHLKKALLMRFKSG